MQRMPSAMDIENYRDYFLVKFRDMDGLCLTHEYTMWPGKQLDVIALVEVLSRRTIYTFNGVNYDLPILALALHEVDNNTLKEANDAIIVGKVKWWDFLKRYGIRIPDYIDHVDLREVAPGVGISLKMYAGRQHSRQMQDLPIDPSANIPPMQRVIISQYCGNDLEVTCDLKRECDERLKLREALTKQYGVDVRSKSDAQIAEAVIKREWMRHAASSATGTPIDQLNEDIVRQFKPERRYVPHGFTFKYEPAPYLKFQTPEMQRMFATVLGVNFVVTDKEDAYEQARANYDDNGLEIRDDDAVYDSTGKKITTGVRLPPEIKALSIRMGQSEYQMGIGGLHSKESKSVNYTISGKVEISDHDVGSYYPSLILSLGMFPQQLGPVFLAIYEKIYKRRLFQKAEAKRFAKLLKNQANAEPAILGRLIVAMVEAQTEADGLKIVLNGTFGKLLSKFAIMFAPELGIRVTLTGQLALLMLIERLELAGISVISANTDGIVLRTPWHLRAKRDEIIDQWSKDTGLEMEAAFYRMLAARDVNNYIAIKMDGEVKGKGVYAKSGVLNNKHPSKDICGEAVIAYLKNGSPIETTVRSCNDVRKFLVIRGVRGGGGYLPQQYPEMRKLKDRLARQLKKIEKGGNDGADIAEYQAMADEYQAMERERNNAFQYLGKAVRWYYSTNRNGHIAYASSGNLVATSEGAMPAMRLPDAMPSDIDFERYIDEAHSMLADLGLRVHYNPRGIAHGNSMAIAC